MTEILIALVVVMAIGCYALGWMMTDLRNSLALARTEHKLKQQQLTTELTEARTTLRNLQAVLDKPKDGLAQRLHENGEVAATLKTYAPHVARRARGLAATIVAHQQFLLDLHAAAPGLFSEATQAALKNHAPLDARLNIVESDDPIGEAGAIVLRAREVLRSVSPQPRERNIYAELVDATSTVLHLMAKRSPAFAESLQAWDDPKA